MQTTSQQSPHSSDAHYSLNGIVFNNYYSYPLTGSPMIPLHDFKRAPSALLVPAHVTMQRFPKVEPRSFHSLFFSDYFSVLTDDPWLYI